MFPAAHAQYLLSLSLAVPKSSAIEILRSTIFTYILARIPTLIDDVTAAIFIEKRGHCHDLNFNPIFLKFDLKVP